MNTVTGSNDPGEAKRTDDRMRLAELKKRVERELSYIDWAGLHAADPTDTRPHDMLDAIATMAAASRDRLNGKEPQDIGVGGKRGTYLRAVRKALGFLVP